MKNVVVAIRMITGPVGRFAVYPMNRPVDVKHILPIIEMIIILQSRFVNCPAMDAGSVNKAITIITPTILTSKTIVNAISRSNSK